MFSISYGKVYSSVVSFRIRPFEFNDGFVVIIIFGFIPKGTVHRWCIQIVESNADDHLSGA